MRSGGRELVALRAPQDPGFRSRLEALWAAGAAVLPLADDLPAPEVRTILERVRPARLIEADGETPLERPLPVDPDTDLVVLTSGSTGAPKGVELSRAALGAAARMTTEHLGCVPGERWLCCVPVTRIAGLSILARSEVLGSEPVITRFDSAAVERAEDCRYVSLVPTMLHRLLEAEADLTRWNAILLGGAAPRPGLVERAVQAGARVVRTYGMTETGGGVVYDGIPLGDVQVKVDEDDVVHLKTPSLMQRYRLDEKLTERALRAGWYRTGDVGAFEGTRLQIVGREDDAIVTGGEKVFPLEVERALLAHPDVRSARVFGEADEEWGQRVVARVSGHVDRETLRSFLKGRIARYKVPSRFEMEELS